MQSILTQSLLPNPARPNSFRENPSMHKRRRVWLGLLTAGVVLALAGAGAVWWHQTTRPEYRLRRGLEAVRQARYATAEEIARRLETAGDTEHARLLRAAVHLELDRPGDAVA